MYPIATAAVAWNCITVLELYYTVHTQSEGKIFLSSYIRLYSK